MSKDMKKFKLAPLVMALSTIIITPIVNSEVPSLGDLSIYSDSSNADKSPTIMLVLEGSTFTNYADAVPEMLGDSEIITAAIWSNTVPRYKRLRYYNSLSNPGGTDESKYYPTRLTRMKDAMFYLMDTPNLLPNDYRIGLTRYSGGTVVKDNPAVGGDGETANVVLAAKELGPVIAKYDYIKHSQGSFVKPKGGEYIRIQDQKYEKLLGQDVYYALPTGSYLKKDGIYYTKKINGKYVPNDKGDYVSDGRGNYRKIDGSYFIKINDKNSRYELTNNQVQRYDMTCSGTDEKGNRIEYSHRCEIKKYVAAMCDADVLCTGMSPMAIAYAEAGAYMMGTKTSTLVAKPGTVDPNSLAYPRPLRWVYSKKRWEYCPMENRTMIPYLDNGIKRFRMECPEEITITLDDGQTIKEPGWVHVHSGNVAHWYWAGADNQASERDLQKIQGKDKYDLLWYNTEDGPYGAGIGAVNRLSAYDKTVKQYSFKKDTFQNHKPTIDKDGQATDAGHVDKNYLYYIDGNADPSSGLYPQLLYRPFRKKIGTEFANTVWQYCALEDATLYNHDVASYRLTCDEDHWRDISKDKLTYTVDGQTKQVTVNGVPVQWNCGLIRTCVITNKPAGTDWPSSPTGISNLTQREHYFLQDSSLSPYDGWQYYYDQRYQSDIKLPPTLAHLSGFRASSIRNAPPEVREKHSFTYNKPNYSECSGIIQYDATGKPVAGPQSVENAIMFITAGWPTMNATYAAPVNEMNMSLSPASSSQIRVVDGKPVQACNPQKQGELYSSHPANNFWCEMGQYAKRLRQAEYGSGKTHINPSGVSIKTGVFMFSSMNNTERLKTLRAVKGTVNGVPIYECNRSENASIAQACRLGQYGEGFGEGGFFLSTSENPEKSYQELAKAIVKMTDNLTTEVGSIPVGMPSVSQNPLEPNKLFDSGYLPIIAPNPGTNIAHWAGNLRKYKQTDRGFEDKNGHSPFSSKDNVILTENTKDFWSTRSVKSAKQEGGAYEQLPYPNPHQTAAMRQVYVSTPSNNTRLTKVTAANIDNVCINGLPSGYVCNTNKTNNNTTEQNTVRNLFLNYLGYRLDNYRQGMDVNSIEATYDPGFKTLGGVNHSTPTVLVTQAKRDAQGKYQDMSKYVMFGAMDNALHIVEDKTGKEVMAYFPQEVLASHGQYKAITKAGVASSDELSPAFGVDAPWESYSEYGYANGTDESKVVATKLYAYGGARLGGKAYYGINLTGLGKTGFNPEQIFTISPDTVVDGKKVFDRLGYTWAKPVLTHINWRGERRLVAILSGGYDLSYDKSDATRLAEGIHNQQTLGNAIYIVDADPTIKDPNNPNQTIKNPNVGKPLIVASNNDAIKNYKGSLPTLTNGFSSETRQDKFVAVYNENMNFSIPGAVKVMDRNADELTDHVYFADLNGQVFRLDINNLESKAAGKASKDGVNTAVRLTRLANLNENINNGTVTAPGPRLYETPVVTIQQREDGKRFATVSVASGDRSNPLEVKDPDNETARLSVTYVDVNGNIKTVEAHRVSKLETTVSVNGKKETTVVTSWKKFKGFDGGNQITLNQNTGVITIPKNLRKEGTDVSATATFLSKYSAMNTAKANNSRSNQNPLAPSINFGANIIITPASTSSLDDKVKTPNYVYTIYDKDVATTGLYDSKRALNSKDMLMNDADFPDVTSGSRVVSDYSKKGWRAAVQRYGAAKAGGKYNTSNALKVMGPLSAIANSLYVSAYNPNDGKADVTGCTTQLLGESEVIRYCLPYGICDSSYTDQYQRINLGKGLTPVTWISGSTETSRQLFTQEQFVTDDHGVSKTNEPQPLNSGSGRTAPDFPETHRFSPILKPVKWYDTSNEIMQTQSSPAGNNTNSAGTGRP